ncbi:MAG: TonB-dependent receptor domain-containing protein [Parvularculaceae bacterium]
MIKRSRIAVGVRAAIACGASALALATAAQAQGDETDEIVVTGSRIAVNAATSAANPVAVIGGDEITTSGETDIAFLLRESPSLQGSLPGNFSAFNAADNNSASDLGASFLNLRSLGINRTLVLQNGRRHVPGGNGQSSVDVNTIPASLIERVEVLTGGASSIYGADAVSGVVNFILRDGSDFDGLEVRLQGGISDEGDAQEGLITVAYGDEFAGGRGQFVAGVEYTRNSSVFSSERDFAGLGLASAIPVNDDIAAAFGVNPLASNTFVTDRRLPVSSALGIVSILNGAPPPEFDDDGNLIGGALGGEAGQAGFALGLLGPNGELGAVPLNDGSGSGVPRFQVVDGELRPFNPADVFVGLFAGVGGDGVPATPDSELILPSSDRILTNFSATYDLNDRHKVFFEGKYAFTDTFDSVQVNGFNDDIPIALDNPFIPTALQTQLDGLIAQGVDPILAISRDTLDTIALPRVDAERTTLRFVGGVEGELPFGLNYSVSYNYGRTDADIRFINTRIEERFFASVDAVVDPATGDIVCRSSIDPTAVPASPGFPFVPFNTDADGDFDPVTFDLNDGQCQPTSLFGADAISPEAAAFAFVDTFEETVITQNVVSAVVTGDTSEYFELPAGPIGFALGFEYRDEDNTFTPDPLVLQELTFGSNNSGPTLALEGSQTATEGYLEAVIPLAAEERFAEYLEFKGSARFSAYDGIGRTNTWSIGGRYQPVESLTFRGTFAIAIRVPNIAELFSPQQPATIGADDDPCNPEEIGNGTEFREANCLAFVAPGFDSTDFNTAFVPGLSGGNPDLEPERAETWTVGFVLEPEYIPNLTIIADFYDIDIDGAIDDLSAFDIAEACVDLPSIDNQFCSQIDRDTVNGNITGFSSGQINLGALQTQGVDWSVTYSFELADLFGGGGDYGDLRFNSVGTYFIQFNEFQDPVDFTVFENLLGEFAIPEIITNFSADWNYRGFRLGWRGRYESSQLLNDDSLSNEALAANPLAFDPFETGSAFVHDFTADYQLSDQFRIYGGVNNALDRDPFLSTLSRPAGPRGRFFFLGLEADF